MALVIFPHWKNAPAPTSPMLAGKAIEVRLAQLQKAFCSIVSTPSETETELRFWHSRKALSPMVFTPEGIVTEIIEDLRKALLPMAVTLEAISALRTPQSRKAQEPMLVTPFPITTFRIWLLLLLHGCSLALLKSGIAPLPEMVSVPAFVRFQERPPSRIPDATDTLASGSSGGI